MQRRVPLATTGSVSTYHSGVSVVGRFFRQARVLPPRGSERAEEVSPGRVAPGGPADRCADSAASPTWREPAAACDVNEYKLDTRPVSRFRYDFYFLY